MIRTHLCLLTLTLCFLISGCGVRPSETKTYVVVRPGDPIQIVDLKAQKGEKVEVTGSTLKGGAVSSEDVTGWIAMPPEHWEIIKAALEKTQAPNK